MAGWRQVTPAEAMQHPLYGVGGWLLFFMILQIIGIVFNIYQLTQAAGFQVVATIVGLIIGLLIVLLCFSRNRLFPVVTITLLWIGIAVGIINVVIVSSTIDAAIAELAAQEGADAAAAALVGSAVTGALYGALAVTAIIAVLLTWYLVSSKRVNVTFRHRAPE